MLLAAFKIFYSIIVILYRPISKGVKPVRKKSGEKESQKIILETFNFTDHIEREAFGNIIGNWKSKQSTQFLRTRYSVIDFVYFIIDFVLFQNYEHFL